MNSFESYNILLIKRLGVFFRFGIIAILVFSIYALDEPQIADNNAKYKAVFIKNFTKYIEWPAGKSTGAFVIGILGNYPVLTKELTTMSQDKKVGDQSMSVATYKSVEEIGQCHVLYIASDQSDKLKNILDKAAKNNMLVITDKEGLAKQGAAINFIFLDNRLRFELSNSNLKKSNLKVDSKLLVLAEVVD